MEVSRLVEKISRVVAFLLNQHNRICAEGDLGDQILKERNKEFDRILRVVRYQG